MAYGLWDQVNWLTKTVKRLCCAVANIAKEEAINNPPYVEVVWKTNADVWSKLSFANQDLDGNFTSIITLGNVQRLYGGSNIIISSNYMVNKTELLSIDDPSGMIIEVVNAQFQGCSALTFINLAKAQITGTQTFVTCSALTYVNIPATLQIGDQCFNTCNSLQTINLNACTAIDYGVFGAFPNVTGAVITIKLAPSLWTNQSILDLIANANTVTLIAP